MSKCCEHDYISWAEQYEADAAKIRDTIERKKTLRRSRMTADKRQRLNAEIADFQHIYRELLSIACTLKERAKNTHDDERNPYAFVNRNLK